MSRGVEHGLALYGEVVLVLDGDEVARDRMRCILGREGCSAMAAANLKSARRLLRTNQVTAVVTADKVDGIDTRTLIEEIAQLELPTGLMVIADPGMTNEAADEWAHAGAELVHRADVTGEAFLEGAGTIVNRAKEWRAAKAANCPPIDPQVELFGLSVTQVRVIRTRDGKTITPADLEERYRQLVSGERPPTAKQLKYLRMWALGHSRAEMASQWERPVTPHAVKKGLRTLWKKAGLNNLAELEEALGIVVSSRRS